MFRRLKKRGAVGIGTLIVFIAMVLVAAVAAAVLINTSGFLQQKASSTGRQTTQEVASGIKVTKVVGYDPATPPASGKIEKLAVYVSPNAGSAGIDMKKVRVVLSDGDRQAIFNYFVGDFTDSTTGVKVDTQSDFNSGNAFTITNKLSLSLTVSGTTPSTLTISDDNGHSIGISLSDSDGDGVYTGTLYADHDATIALVYNNKVVGSLVLDKGANTIAVKVTDASDGSTDVDYIEVYNEKYPIHKITWGNKNGDGVDLSSANNFVVLKVDGSTKAVTLDKQQDLNSGDQKTVSDGDSVSISYNMGTDTAFGGGDDTITIAGLSLTLTDDSGYSGPEAYHGYAYLYVSENVSITIGGQTIVLHPGANRVDVYADESGGDSNDVDYVKVVIGGATFEWTDSDEGGSGDSSSTETTATVVSDTASIADTAPSLVGAAFTGFDELSGSIFGETNDAWAGIRATTNFGLIVVQDNDNSLRDATPTLNNGDIAIITIDVGKVFNGGFQPRQKVTGKVIPEFGAPGVIEFTTPTSFNSNVITLQ